jgi:succinate dehydrogenase/fumarate reductase flavoprotein subunit
VAVDADWQSSVKGLYAVGEAAGTFGMYRPGGSALNSAQVGSMRAAQHIAGKESEENAAVIGVAAVTHTKDTAGAFDFSRQLRENQHRMSLCAAYEREPAEMRVLYGDLKNQWKNHQKGTLDVNVKDASGLPAFYKYIDLLVTQMNVLSAMILAAEVFGGRGGAMVKGAQVSTVRNRVITTTGSLTHAGVSNVEEVRPLDLPDDWFENIWK